MSTQPLDHEQVIELLPDYAIGGLDQADLDRIAQHLEGCSSCRGELLGTLELGALISNVAPPAAAVRRQLLSLANNEAETRPTNVAAPRDDQPAPVLLSRRSQIERAGFGWSRRTQAILAAAAALLLIIGLGIANLRLREDDQRYATIAELVLSATVYPLIESQLTPQASGVLFAAADGAHGLLIADDLPPSSPDEEYQIWLFDERGQSSSAGLFTAGEDGRAQIELTPPRALSSYVAVAVSAEPAGGSEEPSGQLALGGWLDPP